MHGLSGSLSKKPCVMEMWITGYSAMENAIHSTWKSKGSFPTSCKQRFPQLHKTASYPHSHNADDYGNRPFPTCHLEKQNL